MRMMLRNLLSTRSGRVHWLPVTLILLAVAPCAWPQASTATVTGTVRDQSGAVIAKAAVELTNTATGFVWRTTSNEVGYYPEFPFSAPVQDECTPAPPASRPT